MKFSSLKTVLGVMAFIACVVCVCASCGPKKNYTAVDYLPADSNFVIYGDSAAIFESPAMLNLLKA